MTDTNKGGYTYDPKSRRFKGPNGRYISAARITGLRDSIIDDTKTRTGWLVQGLFDGTVSPAGFVQDMRGLVKSTTMMEYMLGRGGLHMMTQSDYGRVGGLLKSQYRYLNDFALDVVDGNVTLDQAMYRAGLYVDTTRAAHERGLAHAWGVQMPEYPGVHPNCRCYLTYTAVDDGVDVYWRIGGANPCHDCLDRAATYNPYQHRP